VNGNPTSRGMDATQLRTGRSPASARGNGRPHPSERDGVLVAGGPTVVDDADLGHGRWRRDDDRLRP
jgi:hypothetical protein